MSETVIVYHKDKAVYATNHDNGKVMLYIEEILERGRYYKLREGKIRGEKVLDKVFHEGDLEEEKAV
ncbi:hypothetical protein IMSHALPRED_005185 [Imshaugia aleurites]|uniref:Uncharacterized protein n=1 Tax=Imshaugia aleurites TaxID=172621 RepID=A0A8H3IB13_9LECA|nr:hypothetical protein IMSHALPRED_005185 [Imshaugia aleurites]